MTKVPSKPSASAPPLMATTTVIPWATSMAMALLMIATT
jgi:hypothetical protein